MVQYEPRDLPRLRDELVRFGRSDIAAMMRDLDEKEGRTRPGRARSTAEAMKNATIRPDADLFYVTPEMCELAEVASRSLPEFTLGPDDAPSYAGMLWFARPINDHDADEVRVDVAAVTWETRGTDTRMAMLVDRELPIFHMAHSWGPKDLLRLGFPPVFPLGHWDVPLSTDGQPLPIENNGLAGRHVLAVVKTIWLMLRQPMTEQETIEPNRTQRRQAAREGREAPPVRVIRLRRPQGGGNGTGSVAWHHQWMVRGHWRMQAWGPGRQQRRPVWIAPFVKGPEGAPMLGGEKVYLFDRATGEPLVRLESPEAPPDLG